MRRPLLVTTVVLIPLIALLAVWNQQKVTSGPMADIISNLELHAEYEGNLNSSVNGYTGTGTGSPTYATGHGGGQALDLENSSGQYVTYSTGIPISGVSQLTYAAWVWIESHADFRNICNKGSGNNYLTLGTGGTGAGSQTGLLAGVGSGQYGVTPGSVLTTGAWHHVAYVYDGTQTGNANRLKVYVDKVQQTLTFTGTIDSTTPAGATGAFIVGDLGSNPSWDGLIDDLRVYTRALTQSDINELFDGPAVTIAIDNAALFFSPYNWTKSGSTYAQTNTPGAYLKTQFTGTSCKLLVDVAPLSGVSAGNYPAIEYKVDGGSWTRTQLTSSTTNVQVATGLSAGTHTLDVRYVAVAWNSNDRWTTPVMVLRITGLEIDAAAAVSSPTLASGRIMFFGDSHGEGHEVTSSGVSVANQNARLAYPNLVAASLSAEFGVAAFAGQGYTAAVATANVPDCEDAWDFYSNGVSRLSGGAFIGGEPDSIIICHGDNDSSNPQTACQATITAILAATTTAKIYVCSAPNLQQASAVSAAVTAIGNARVKYVDTLVDLSGVGGKWNGGHLSQSGQVDYAAAIVAGILAGTPTNTTPPSIAGTPTEGQTLTLTPGVWEDEDSVSTQWYENGSASTSGGTPISAVTVARYSNKGKYLYVGEIGTNGEGDSDEVFSNIIGPIAGAVGQGPRINGGLVRCI